MFSECNILLVMVERFSSLRCEPGRKVPDAGAGLPQSHLTVKPWGEEPVRLWLGLGYCPHTDAGAQATRRHVPGASLHPLHLPATPLTICSQTLSKALPAAPPPGDLRKSSRPPAVAPPLGFGLRPRNPGPGAAPPRGGSREARRRGPAR